MCHFRFHRTHLWLICDANHCSKWLCSSIFLLLFLSDNFPSRSDFLFFCMQLHSFIANSQMHFANHMYIWLRSIPTWKLGEGWTLLEWFCLQAVVQHDFWSRLACPGGSSLNAQQPIPTRLQIYVSADFLPPPVLQPYVLRAPPLRERQGQLTELVAPTLHRVSFSFSLRFSVLKFKQDAANQNYFFKKFSM